MKILWLFVYSVMVILILGEMVYSCSANEKPSVDYNFTKDTAIRNAIEGPQFNAQVNDFRARFNVIYFHIKSKRLMIFAIHHILVEYKEPDSWEFYFIMKDGNPIVVTGDVKEDSISPETIELIKITCNSLL